ncbi:DUF5984 family protein [Kribbella sp.]|uniref:DUF5984 family protein n=1 Tax=Kribbella sp. TaxID=1871183 RepID=UPI002D77F3D0|nr:DUF5984 family protein [Kribbella sp.]
MSELRFGFELTPLGEVGAWGRERPNLHWFGLTDGWYWIEVDEVRLLRFSADYEIPYVDYYVARLWEDLLQLLPVVLEEVPADLVGFLRSDHHGWNEIESEAADAAMDWWSGRYMYLGYLREPPTLCCWRTGDQVTIDWQAPSNFAEPRVLQVTVGVEEFVAAVEEFDRSLLAAMEARIAEVEASPPVGVGLDLAQLRSEHRDRSNWLAHARARLRSTDWSAVRAGAARLLP